MKVYRSKKPVPFDTHSFCVGLVLASAAASRVILISLGWPTTNSDEATMGLMARHIAYLGEHPIFMYGQNYMGSLESHIGAALFLLLGPSLSTLRFGLVLLDILFFFVLYRLTCLLYTRGMALFVLILLCFGSTETLSRQLKVLGGAVETMLFGSLLLLMATWLALTCQKRTDKGECRIVPVQRLLRYAGFGLVIGLGMWSHLLVLPFVGAALLLLILLNRGEMNKRVWFCLSGGLLLGFSPTLIFDIEHPLQNAIGALWQVQSSGGLATTLPYTFWDQIRGMVLVSLPMATGFNSSCNTSSDPGVWRSDISSCVLAQGMWGLAYLLLMGIAAVFAARELRRCYLIYRKSQGEAERHALVYAVARAMPLVCGSLTLLAFLCSPAPALVPITSARYLVGLTVMLPALIAPLWSAAQHSIKRRQERIQPSRGCWQQRGRALASGLVLLLIVGNFGISLVAVFQQVPSVQAFNRQQNALVTDLLHAHIMHIYSDYWTCNRIIFQSDERITCSVLDNQLQTGQNRYAPYQQIVQSDPNASYVFGNGSSQVTAFVQHAAHSKAKYNIMPMDGYIVYTPTGAPQVFANGWEKARFTRTAPCVGTMPCACPRPCEDSASASGRGQAQGIVPTHDASSMQKSGVRIVVTIVTVVTGNFSDSGTQDIGNVTN